MFYFITSIVLILKEIGLFWQVKKLIHKNNYYLYKKPYDCFFCLSFWANTLLLIPLTIFSYSTSNFYNYGVAILITKIIDLLWNKES